MTPDDRRLLRGSVFLGMGYLGFLDLILREETAAKDSRRCRAALHSSGLPHHKTLDDFDFTFQPGPDVVRSVTWPALAFIEARANLAQLGPPGHG